MTRKSTRRLWLAATSAVALAGFSSSASADIVTMTYTGTVASTSSTDTLNLFGGGNLTGDTVTAVITVNTATESNGVVTSGTVSDGVFSPPALFTIINGNVSYSRSLAQNLLDSSTRASTGGNGVNNASQNDISGTFGGGYNFGIGTTDSATPVAPSELNESHTISIHCGRDCNGSGLIIIGGEEIDVTLIQESTLDTSVTSAVPEPSTWAMMVLGFCGLGFVTYRRRSQAPNAA